MYHLCAWAQFTKLLRMHLQDNRLGKNEADIMSGAMSLSDQIVRNIMTDRSKMFSLKISALALCYGSSLAQGV
jgi:Mg2+/Co2+ transporter CorC